MVEKIGTMEFPPFSGIRCLMMPYIQGDLSSVPKEYHTYRNFITDFYFEKGKIGFLTIDESPAFKNVPHRGNRSKYERALHTEAGVLPNFGYKWGSSSWGESPEVELEEDVMILLANNVSGSCAVWDVEQKETTEDGDIGHLAHLYPYEKATLLDAGEVWKIGIFTPHESLPLKKNCNRQFLRLVSSGVHGRESYFTQNPLVHFE